MTEEEKAAEYQRSLRLPTGGAYLPPHRVRALQEKIGQDKQSEQWQRLAHDARKKACNSLVNKLSVSNIKVICQESFNEDLIKARGLLVQALLRAQSASISFTPVYAAYVAVISSKLPVIGDICYKRLLHRFSRAYRRNDKAPCLSSVTFLAHLANQDVISNLVCPMVLQLLLEKPTDDSVEIAISLMTNIGQGLEESNPPIAQLLADRLRQILQESSLENRTLYSIEVLFQKRKERYSTQPKIPEGLDLVQEEDKITLEAISPDQWLKLDPQSSLNIFQFDYEYAKHNKEWEKTRNEIFGEASDEEGESGSEVESESASEGQSDNEAQDIKDLTAVSIHKSSTMC